MHVHLAAPPLTRRAKRAPARLRKGGTQPGQLFLGGDVGSRIAAALSLQQSVGNGAVALLVSQHAGGGNAVNVRLHGQTSGAYDGGSSKVLNQKVAKAKGCDCPQEDPCLQATGTLQMTYKVDVTIVMPEVPGGLNECQEQRVRTFLRDVLGPHEREHARRLRTYDGTTTRPFSVTACGQQALTDDVNTKLQEMHDSEAQQRATDADALSAAIDPFEKDIDLNC